MSWSLTSGIFWSKLPNLSRPQFSHLEKGPINTISAAFDVRSKIAFVLLGSTDVHHDGPGSCHGEMTPAEAHGAVEVTEVLALKQDRCHCVSFCQTTQAYTVGDGCCEQTPSVPIQLEGRWLPILNRLLFFPSRNKWSLGQWSD